VRPRVVALGYLLVQNRLQVLIANKKYPPVKQQRFLCWPFFKKRPASSESKDPQSFAFTTWLHQLTDDGIRTRGLSVALTN
jgi:hypothetical protein